MNVTVTKWDMDTVMNLEQIQQLLIQNRLKETTIDWDDDPLKNEFLPAEGTDLGKINTILLDRLRYEYIIFVAKVERAVSKKHWYDENNILKDREERVRKLEATFIVYKTESEIKIISIGAPTTVRKIVNFIFEKSVWGDINVNNFGVKEDMYYWLLDRLRDDENHNLSEVGDIKITGLLSYLGRTDDGNNAVRGNGRRVLSILGTLAYIFSSDSLKAIRPEFQYNGQIFVIELPMNNSFKIYNEYCTGAYNTYTGQEKITALSIYVIENIIPAVLRGYKYSVRKELWSDEIKSAFLKSIGKELIETINNRMVSLIEDDQHNEEDGSIDDLCSELEEDLPEGDLVI